MTSSARAYDFLARGDMGGTRVAESPFGRAVYTDELPRRLDGNYLWVDRAAEPEELVAEAARLERRLIFVPDPAIGDSLAPWFKQQGWRIDRHVVMAQLREPELEADLSLVREVDEPELREARKRVLANEPWASPEVLDQIFAAKGLIGRRVRTRFFAVEVDGEVVSYSDLYLDGADAQVEDVGTLPEQRGRGLREGGRARGDRGGAAGRRGVRLPRRRRERLAEGALPPARLRRARPLHEVLRAAREVTAALSARALEKRYGSTTALAGVDLEVGEGELVGLLGPNGAGKSTLVKIACGLVRPTRGHAEICGAQAGSLEARRRIGYLAELFRFPGWYSADELLALHQRLAGSTRRREAEREELLELVGLAEARERRVEEMSKGMQQRLGIAQALVGAPPLLLLDEPTSALDPVGRRTVRQLLEELRRRGTSVLLNSHLLSEIELVCDRVVILLRGEVVTEGSPAELSRPRGVEIETDEGARLFEGRPRGRAAPRRRARRRGPQGLRRARADLDARGHLPRGRRRGDLVRADSDDRRLRLARGAAAQGVRGRAAADRRLPRALLARQPLRLPRHRQRRRAAPGSSRGPSRARSCSASRCSRRSSSGSCSRSS